VSLRPWICLVTDRRRLCDADARRTHEPGTNERLIELVRDAAEAGVDLIQVREPDVEAGALCALVERCLRATEGSGVRIVVNDRLDVALAVGAAGVHLSSRSVPADRVRSIAPAPFLVGRSVHDARETAAQVAAGGLDYLVFGTVFESASKPGMPPVGLQRLREAVQSAGSVPVLAIGGLTTTTAPLAAAAGAAGVAAIGAFLPVPSRPPMRALVGQLRAAFDARGITQ
jgi:thiamine-phosphate pyrophosphorylase